MGADYVIFGGLRLDYLITAAGAVVTRQCGGNALYSAAGAAVWTSGVGIVSRTAPDYPLEWLEQARRRGIDTSGVRYVSEPVDLRTFYAYQPDGSRVESNPEVHFRALGLEVPEELRNYRQASADQAEEVYRAVSLQPGDLPAGYLGSRGYHLASGNYASHARIAGYLRESGARLVTLDPGARYMSAGSVKAVRSLLAHVDVFLPSQAEVVGLLGEVSAGDAARWFADCGPCVVVIKQAEQGCLVYDAQHNSTTAVPAYPARVSDVTGAGDAFCGGFLVGYAETGDPVEAALRGAVSASFTVEGFGALYATQFTRAEAEARLAALCRQWRGE